jgi:hypothetical protein
MIGMIHVRGSAPQRRRHGRRSGAVKDAKEVHRGNGTGPQRKRSVAAPSASAGSSCTEKSRSRAGGTEACRRRRRPTCAGGRGSAASACTHMSHVTISTTKLLVVEVQLAERHVVQLAERHVRSRACHVGVEVARARTAVRGATQRRIGLRKALKKASLSHTLRRSWRARQSRPTVRHTPSVARTCLAMCFSSPLQRCGACLRANLDNLTG